jgi:hypothetical protein
MGTFLEWSAPEFEKAERGIFWHFGIIGLAALLVLFSLWQRNYVFLLFVVFAAAMMIFISRNESTVYTYGIAEDGIEVDGKLIYGIRSLTGFALLDDGFSPYGELVIRRTKRLTEYVRILIPREKIDPARELLAGALKEFTYNETLGEVIMKRFGL